MHFHHELPFCQMLDDIATRGASVVVLRLAELGIGWAHTIGLVERFDHPELVSFGPPGRIGPMLSALAGLVADGERWCDDDVTELDGTLLGFRAGDDALPREGWLDSWFEFYADVPELRLSVLEVGRAEVMFAP